MGHGKIELRDGLKLFWRGKRKGRNGVCFKGNENIIEAVRFIDRMFKSNISIKGEQLMELM